MGCVMLSTISFSDSVVVDTKMTIIDCHWNHNGTVLAVAGHTQEKTNVVQFFNAYGEVSSLIN